MEQSIVHPLLAELERISGRVDTERAAADQALIADLRREIAELRAPAFARATSVSVSEHDS